MSLQDKVDISKDKVCGTCSECVKQDKLEPGDIWKGRQSGFCLLEFVGKDLLQKACEKHQ
jgi:hypothetical protein